jgi:hypothetical protein
MLYPVQPGCKVKPLRVLRLDQFDLPRALPFFDLLFAAKRRFPIVVSFVPDKPIDTIFGGEARNRFRLVFPDTLRQIGGDAGV